MSKVNRQWLLRRRPVGMVKESDFELHEAPMPKPGPGEALVKNLFLAFEPAMRGWMEDRESYLPPVGIGDVMRGMTVGQVVESNFDGLAPGDLVSGFTGWQEWCIGDANVTKLAAGATPEFALSILGATGMTAYFGLLDVGKPKPGETLVVSGAAGATGRCNLPVVSCRYQRRHRIAGNVDHPAGSDIRHLRIDRRFEHRKYQCYRRWQCWRV